MNAPILPVLRRLRRHPSRTGRGLLPGSRQRYHPPDSERFYDPQGHSRRNCRVCFGRRRLPGTGTGGQETSYSYEYEYECNTA